ncbi:hypothetical protein ACTA71_004689 [Dictyostelium dimigraforme]
MKKMLFMNKKDKKEEQSSAHSNLAQQHQLAQQQYQLQQQQLQLQYQQHQQQLQLAQQQKQNEQNLAQLSTSSGSINSNNTTATNNSSSSVSSTSTTSSSSSTNNTTAAPILKAHDFCGTIMILGHTESGKTTLQRQLEFIYGVTDPTDAKHYQRLIYGNTLATLIRFIENSERLNITLSPDNLARVKRIQSQPVELSRNRLPKFPLKLGWDCKCIWEDKVIQSVYNHSKVCSEIRTPGRPK